MADRYCLVAGSGDLVDQIVAAAMRRGLDLHVMSLMGPRDLGAVPVHVCDQADLNDLFGRIRQIGANLVVLAGYIAPATWDALYAYPALGLGGERVGTAELARRLEAAFPSLTGAPLAGINEIAPELIAPDGAVAGPDLSPRLRAQALSALGKARELGTRDVGQAVVLSPEGRVEAEDARGTDALLRRVAAAGQRSSGPWILAKALKPRQPVTMDLPVIGPQTLEHARDAGISVVALEAGGVLIVNRPAVEEAARTAGISVVGLAF